MTTTGDPFAPAHPRHRTLRWRIVALLGSVALVMAGCGADPDDSVPGAGDVAGAPVTQAEVVAGDLFFEPGEIDVPAGNSLEVTLVNEGEIQHDIRIDEAHTTPLVDPGDSATANLGLIDGGAVVYCSIPGHREAGMELALTVAGESGELVSAGTGGTERSGAQIDFTAEPDADWQPFDPTLEPAPGGTDHEILMLMDETVMEVAPGVTQEMWTFNGTFPGPTLRGKVGDLFTVTVRNEGEMAHSIDFHASLEAWDDEMRELSPGEELTYQFQAEYSGIFMYHCGAPPALHHIGNGMHGAIIIDPPDLAPVDHEFVLVQSELYTGPEGGPGDLDKMTADAWDAVVFNGYVNQYKFAPIRVEPEERIRVWIVDNGPSENSSFHIVGTIFDTVYKEGAYTLRPDASRGGSQALDLLPAQGGFVEFTFAEPGLYPIVTHKFSNVGKGALGLFQAGEVPDRDSDGVVRPAGGDAPGSGSDG